MAMAFIGTPLMSRYYFQKLLGKPSSESPKSLQKWLNSREPVG